MIRTKMIHEHIDWINSNLEAKTMKIYLMIVFSSLILNGCTINLTTTVCDTHGVADDVIDTSTSTPNEVETDAKVSIPAMGI